MIFSLIFSLLIGWLAGAVINHAANALPLKQLLWQRPFCKRRLNYAGPEAISTARQGETEPAAEPVYCLTPRPAVAWSAVIAWATGRRACAACGKLLGLRALLVEIFTPVLFLLAYQRFGPSVYLGLAWAYIAILVLLMVTDLEHRLIQHKIILPAILLAVIGGFFSLPHFGWRAALLGGAVAFVSFYALAWLSRGGLGEGDVTLATFLGLITALPNVIITLIYGILLGGLVSVGLILTRRATLKTFIPYGPFLIIAGLVMLLWGDALSAWVWR